MAKSSKKQCRTPKPKRQAGGLVVVSQRNLQSDAPQHRLEPNKRKANKKGKRKRGLGLGDLMAPDNGDESDDFDASPSACCASITSEVAKCVFSSTHHSRQQLLYYLLATRPAEQPAAGQQQQQAGEGGVASASVATVEGGCHALVFVETTAAAQELIGELKALSLVAFAVHDRTPKGQIQDHIKRFLAAPSSERSSVLVLTNLAIARTLPSIVPAKSSQGKLLRVVHFDAPEGGKNTAARARVAGGFFLGRGAGMAEEIHLHGGVETTHLTPYSFDSRAMGGIRSRLAVAKKLSRAIALSAGEGEDRGMQRAAAAAGLEWDEHSSESGAEVAKREKKRAHAQQAVALRRKVSVLLCQPLLPAPEAAASGSTGSAPAPKNAQQSAKELRKKMTILGMIHDPQQDAGGGGPLAVASAAGKGMGALPAEDRTAAQTRWLDGSIGKVFGGSWDGSVRTGASCDTTSLELRARVEAAKQGGNAAAAAMAGRDGKEVGEGGVATVALAKWRPNPSTPDPEKWGGRWGKPCGHNEVVLQHLRPFAPLEVINTRVCSKASPAPGNAGFDGCLELLSLTCQAHGRALTAWDSTAFVYMDKTGACSSLPKQELLHLSLPTLRFLVKNMRGFTVCGGGQKSPREVARAVIRSAGWGAKQSKLGPLSAELSRRVMSFVLSGDLATWRSASAAFGLVGLHQGAAVEGGGETTARDTLAFASKKKRKNFNL